MDETYSLGLAHGRRGAEEEFAVTMVALVASSPSGELRAKRGAMQDAIGKALEIFDDPATGDRVYRVRQL